MLYHIFSTELMHLNIGYELNEHAVEKMLDIINIIDYVGKGNSSTDEIITILQMYE